MQVQNKKNALIFDMRIKNFRGIEVFAYHFEKGKPLIVYGDNGEGKTSIILALYAALDKRKIPIKYNSLVGPYSIEGIKKAKVELGIEGDSGILELNGKSLEKFYVNFSITEKGTVNLSLSDAITGEVDKSPSKEKIKNLLGLFIDPVDLANTLEEPNGDRKLAEKLCSMMGFDLKPFSDLEDELFSELQAENVELKRQEGEFLSLDKPQDDWATKYTDPALISKQIQMYNDFTTRNKDRELNIDTVKVEQQNEKKINDKLTEEIELIGKEVGFSDNTLTFQEEKLNEEKTLFESFSKNNKPDKWLGSESIVVVEKEIAELTNRAKIFREYDRNILEGTKNIEASVERVSSLKKSLDEKQKFLEKKTQEKTCHNQVLESIATKMTQTVEQNEPEEWKGEVDPDSILKPFEYLNEKMTNVTKWNTEFENRKKYTQSEDGIEIVKDSKAEINKKRDTNQAVKEAAIISVKDKFPLKGLTVDFKRRNMAQSEDEPKKKNEITVWYDSGDGRGKQTILDRSEGEKMRICTNILIAGNTGPLNVIVVRQGHALHVNTQNVVFEVAAEHEYATILETIISEEPGAVLIEAGNVKSVIPPKELTEQIEGRGKREEAKKESEFSW